MLPLTQIKIPGPTLWVLVDTFDPQAHVVGVYDSKAKAKAAADTYERNQVVESEGDTRIEEHRLNQPL